jgi:hypothetical protein
MPSRASRAAMRRDDAGSPEVQSASSASFRMPAMSPSGPSSSDSTSAEVGRQVITTSASVTASRGVSASRAPVSLASSAARSVVRFHSTVGCRSATRTAMGRPMAPSPRNAMRITSS